MADLHRLDDTARTLDVLGILYYVLGGFAALFGLFPILHVALGLTALLNPDLAMFDGPEQARVMGGIFLAVGLVIMVSAFTAQVLALATGRFLRQRRHMLFCTVGAAATCLAIPFGTALGVVTLVFLTRPEAKTLFGVAPVEPVEGHPIDPA